MLASAHVAAYHIHTARVYAKYGWRKIAKAYLKLAKQEQAVEITYPR